MWAWRLLRVWKSLSLGRGARSGSGMMEYESAKNTNIGRLLCGREVYSGRGRRFRFGLGHFYSSRKFVGSSRRLPCGRRGAHLGRGGRSRSGVVYVLGLGWWNV